MKLITTLLVLLLFAGCASAPLVHEFKLINEVSIEEVLNARKELCVNSSWVKNFQSGREFQELKENCAKTAKAFEHDLEGEYKIYYYEELDQNGNGYTGYALTIDGEVVEKFIAAFQVIT